MDVERLIFNMYKNEILIAKKFKAEIIKKFNVTPVVAGDIFAKIQNHQIKKFGKRLNFDDPQLTSNEKKYISRLATARKQSWKHKHYLDKEKY